MTVADRPDGTLRRLRTGTAGDMDLLGTWLEDGGGRLVSLVSQFFFGLGTFFLGATAGSFLNVVVYRLPRGRSPAEGRSHCPACGSRILARDNIPVLSWLLLQGRCRSCDAPISSRYPLVEAGCGLLFLGLAFLEIVAADPWRSSWWTPLDARPERVAMFLYHALAACTLLAWWLIEFDGGSIPWRHAAGVLAVVSLVPILLPALHPVAADAGFVLPSAFWQATGDLWPPAAGDWFERGVIVSAVGAAVAILLAATLERLYGPSQAVFLGLLLLGVVLGWQGAMWAAAVVVVIGRPESLTGRKTGPDDPLDRGR